MSGGDTAPAQGEALAGLIADAVRLLRASRDWTKHMDELLAEIGTRLGISRVYLFQIHEIEGAGLGQTCRFDWAAPGLAPLASDPRNVDEAVTVDPLFAEWTARRRRGETITGLTRDLGGYLREDYEHQRILSFMSIPIMVNGDWWGHIGFDDCETERLWSAGERSVLESVAYLIGSAIELSGSSLIMSEASRHAMLRAALDAVIIADEAGCVMEFNPAAEAIFGWSREEMIGASVADRLTPASVREAHETGFRRYLAGGEPRILGRRVEAEGRRRDGSLVPIEITVNEIQVARRRLFVAYVRDLTERKAAEAEAERQRHALYQSEKMSALGSLLAGIAHELNNPLSVVVGRAILLEEDCKDPRQRDQLKRLREAAERCARISQNFLKMARQSPVVRARMSLNEAVGAALDIIGYAARSGGVKVELDLEPALPDAFADADQIVQVLVNLMINAIQAMVTVDGPRRLQIRTASDLLAERLTVTVADSGPGIPADVMPRIFEPFFTTKDVGLGTGVGLAVSQGMIASHGGALAAENRPAGGALFRVTLPLHREMALESSAEETDAPAGASGHAVLVVDDEPEVAALLQDILERAGHTVDLAENGAIGLERATAKAYDRIFCDLQMPEVDGPTFRRRLAEHRPDLARRIVFVTGDNFSRAARVGSLDGARVIEKPFRASDILAAVAEE